MKKPLFCFVCMCLGLVVAWADSEHMVMTCARSTTFLAPGDSATDQQRSYARDHDVQALHLALDITPDFKRRTITGVAALKFKPVLKPVQELKLDSVDLNIASVAATEKIEAYQVTEDKIIITFAQPIPVDHETTVTIKYSAEPTKGIYFRTPEMGYKQGDTHLFSQGEAIEGRHWYPCVDAPNQRLTSEMTCHVPEGMTAISNGRLVSETKDPATGLVAIHWSQDKPHANYLITLTAGYLQKVEDTCHGVPLAFYTPASEVKEALSSFRDTKDMVEFFEKEIGVPYPWDKYYQIAVNDFVEGGMENTSATTLMDYTLFTDATENIRESTGLVAHELAHQWFGDYVTCKDWSDTWLNEGFATYYETLYGEHKHGHDAMVYELYSRASQITSMGNDTKAIVRRTYTDPNDMFSYLSYPKASWVLHMLRAQLGPELYRKCIKTYMERHALGNVVTEDLREVVEELSGRSYDQFFDQWLYHGRFPDLDISYSWDEPSKLARISVQQTQEVNQNVLLFNVPLTVRFITKSGPVDRVIQITRKQEDFNLSLDSSPERVRIDPEYTLLAKIKFSVPRHMLYGQLADHSDVAGRLLAIEQLTGHDQETIGHLSKTLNEDPFYGVRNEAARALRSMHTDEALDALLASTSQSDARVRHEVVQAIGGFYNEKAYAALQKVLENEKNPDIVSSAIHGLAAYSKLEVQPVLVKYLNSESYRNELAMAAIGALRSQDDPAGIKPLLDTLSRREPDFTSRGFAQGMEALAYLARNEQNKDNVREFLVAHAQDKRRTVQMAALNGLGTLGDPKALAVVSTFATAAKASSERTTAERIMGDLRAGRKPIDDFKNLRQEVLDLQKGNRDLRRELDELKKKLETVSTMAAKSPSPTPAASPKTHAPKQQIKSGKGTD
jgi:aminopeptidase N